MATTLLALQLFIVASIFLSTSLATVVNGDASIASPVAAPTSQPLLQGHAYPASLFGPLLANLGFHGFSAAAPSLTNATTWRGPATVFAPTDSSLLTCPSCTVSLLLREHTVPGLFPLHYMLTLPFGTKIETLAPGRCITITFSNTSEVFIGGVKITHPDLYNDGLVAVHGLQGFISHLSPYSCDVERMTSLSFPHSLPASPFFLMRLMLKDVMLRLSTSGYGIVALALKLKNAELLDLRSMTVFALDDVAIFSGAGHAYVTNFRLHIVPNRMLMTSDLESFPTGTLLPTMEQGEKLVVTTGGATGVSINYVKIKSPDLIHNLKIVVHGLSTSFPHIHVHPTATGDLEQLQRSRDVGEMLAPPPLIESIVDIHDHHGL